MRVKDIPLRERPRERAWREGLSSLSDTELVAILLRTGRREKSAVALASELMHASNGDWSALGRILRSTSEHPRGLGKVQALTLLTTLELGQRITYAHITPHTIDDALEFVVSRIRHAENERAFIICLNLRNQCMAAPFELSHGTEYQVVLSPHEVLSYVARQHAPRFIVIHNHPSGDPTPSPQDVLLTKQLHEGAQWIGIELQDHVIVTRDQLASFRANGWLD